MRPRKQEILDIDDTFCATHGAQQLAFQETSAPAKRPSQVRSAFRSPGVELLVGFQAAIVRVLPQGIHDPRRPCPGENMRFFNPLAVAFAVDTVISVNRIFLSVTGGRKGWRLAAG